MPATIYFLKSPESPLYVVDPTDLDAEPTCFFKFGDTQTKEGTIRSGYRTHNPSYGGISVIQWVGTDKVPIQLGTKMVQLGPAKAIERLIAQASLPPTGRLKYQVKPVSHNFDNLPASETEWFVSLCPARVLALSRYLRANYDGHTISTPDQLVTLANAAIDCLSVWGPGGPMTVSPMDGPNWDDPPGQTGPSSSSDGNLSDDPPT